MNNIYIIIGSAFGVLFLLMLWIQYMHFRNMEKRMTSNMIYAIEKLEWGENNIKDKGDMEDE